MTLGIGAQVRSCGSVLKTCGVLAVTCFSQDKSTSIMDCRSHKKSATLILKQTCHPDVWCRSSLLFHYSCSHSRCCEWRPWTTFDNVAVGDRQAPKRSHSIFFSSDNKELSHLPLQETMLYVLYTMIVSAMLLDRASRRGNAEAGPTSRRSPG